MSGTVITASVGQIIAIVVAAFLISGITYVFTKNRAMYAMVRAIYAMLTTAKPTDLNPHPTHGLVDVVQDHSRKLDALILTGKALIVDSKIDNGKTSRDALNRIEVEQARVATELATDETTRS